MSYDPWENKFLQKISTECNEQKEMFKMSIVYFYNKIV